MSHVKNLQSFDKVIEICTGLGRKYNPGHLNLQVSTMNSHLQIAQQLWEEFKQAHKVYDNATNARKEAFQGIRKLSSSVQGILKVSDADPLLMADALNAKRKICGARITKPPDAKADGATADTKKKTTRASYAKAYVAVAEYFDELVKTVESEPSYRANETHLTVEGLREMKVKLFALNKSVADAEVRLDEARIKRNEMFYTYPVSMVNTAKAVKAYVRSVLGLDSQEYQLMQKIHFTKPTL
ncbi:MAG: hypothetical protein HYZ44_03655 [Bacteroidetes bacterium]|nr:hypothetical protein [Bacteroidota bacterium]